MIQIYCDVDENGNIIDALMGERIIPDRQYDFFFMVTDAEIMKNIDKYKVINRELVLK